MAFAVLPRDVCFHLLMMVHPVDLYHVSHYIPELRQTVRRGYFQKAYLEKWLPYLKHNLSLDSTGATAAGLMALRRQSYVQQYTSTMSQQLALFFLLERGDVQTARWMIDHFSFSTSPKWGDLFNHPKVTPKIIRSLFERCYVNPSTYLAEQPRSVIDQYLYSYDANYTQFFILLAVRHRYEDLRYYLSPCLSFDVDPLMDSAINQQDGQAIAIYLAQLTYLPEQICSYLRRCQSMPEIRQLLSAHLPLSHVEEDNDELCVEEIDGSPDESCYIEKKYGFIIQLEIIEGGEIVYVLGICSGPRSNKWSELTIRPLTETEKVIALRMMLVLR